MNAHVQDVVFRSVLCPKIVKFDVTFVIYLSFVNRFLKTQETGTNNIRKPGKTLHLNFGNISGFISYFYTQTFFSKEFEKIRQESKWNDFFQNKNVNFVTNDSILDVFMSMCISGNRQT